MNYRHAFHAGNVADVVKHAVMLRILLHLKQKPAPFCVIDTHAGAGLYDLTGPEARRTEEWKAGIGRLVSAPFIPSVRALLAPYLDAVAAFNTADDLRFYPGSPLLALHALRRQDRLLACEREPSVAAALEHRLRSDSRAKVLTADGWVALKANVPPRERRGLVLIDPAYEDQHEFAQLAATFEGAYRRWPTGTYLLWYPITKRSQSGTLTRRLRHIEKAKILRTEILVERPSEDDAGLGGTGLMIVNPPWTLPRDLKILLPALAEVFECAPGAFTLDWIVRE